MERFVDVMIEFSNIHMILERGEVRFANTKKQDEV